MSDTVVSVLDWDEYSHPGTPYDERRYVCAVRYRVAREELSRLVRALAPILKAPTRYGWVYRSPRLGDLTRSRYYCPVAEAYMWPDDLNVWLATTPEPDSLYLACGGDHFFGAAPALLADLTDRRWWEAYLTYHDLRAAL